MFHSEPSSQDEALHYMNQLAAGVAACHAQGIVHRDIKPGTSWITIPVELSLSHTIGFTYAVFLTFTNSQLE